MTNLHFIADTSYKYQQNKRIVVQVIDRSTTVGRKFCKLTQDLSSESQFLGCKLSLFINVNGRLSNYPVCRVMCVGPPFSGSPGGGFS